MTLEDCWLSSLSFSLSLLLHNSAQYMCNIYQNYCDRLTEEEKNLHQRKVEMVGGGWPVALTFPGCSVLDFLWDMEVDVILTSVKI